MPRLGLREWWISLSSEQRFSASVLGFCGSVSLVLSVWYIASNLHAPFRVPNATVTASQKIFAKHKERSEELERSKSKDTDRDGLSDYAELYLYRSSPYLADTDSDGVPDAIEIAQGQNPNCPIGQNCLAIVDASPLRNTSSTFADLLESRDIYNSAMAGALGANDPRVKGAANFVATAPDPTGLSPNAIRELLSQNGLVPAESLVALTDEHVMLVYRAAYTQVIQIRAAQAQGAQGSQATSTQATSTAP